MKVDSDFHVQLQYKCISVPLSQWFVKGHNSRLKKVSMLENLSSHIRNVPFDNYNQLLDESRILESLARCRTMFLFAVSCKIGALEPNAY